MNNPNHILTTLLLITSSFQPALTKGALANAPEQVISQVHEINSHLPKWETITFQSLPYVLQDGEFIATPYLIEKLGWNPSVIWQEGQTLDQFMLLGYFQDNWGLERLTLSEIARHSSQWVNGNAYTVADFGLVEKQTVQSLIQAIPSLANYRIHQLPLIQDVLKTVLHIPPHWTISEALAQYPQLGQLKLDVVNLQNYSLGSLPQLWQTPFNRFQGWQETVIQDIPQLATVPFSAFPNPLTNQGLLFGYASVVFNQHQNQRYQSIVGSYQQGFNVPCSQNCPHVEFSQPPWLNGAHWISGQTLKVKGGRGVLGSVHGGKESAGRHPYGPQFKVVLWDIDEPSARADMVIFFNLCVKKKFIDLGCTPYIFGPFPWFPIQERMWTPI